MDHYLAQSKRYSLVLAELIVVICTVIVMPFLLAATTTTTLQVGFIILTVAVLKAAWMDSALTKLYERSMQQRWIKLIAQWIIPLVILVVTIEVNPIVGFVLALAWLGWAKHLLIKSKNQLLNWRLAVATERQRMLGVYRFFNLFTDVPAVQGTIHRRRYLDLLCTF